MTDVMTPGQRFLAMAHNRGRTRPELAFAAALWHRGLRYVTYNGYKGKYHQKLRKVIFVDGCFWHGCPQCDKNPANSGDFWIKKINSNMERDRKITAHLEREDWTVIRIPEHDIKTKTALNHMADNIKNVIIRGRAQLVGINERP